jgi:hypothetical protein
MNRTIFITMKNAANDDPVPEVAFDEGEQIVRGRIRFALHQLAAQNGSFVFETLARRLARMTVTRNILPATGPVQSGGDQGRDAETYRTDLPGQVQRIGRAIGIQPENGVAFACTLQRNAVLFKFERDVAKIMDSGGPVDFVVAYCEANIPVGPRHAFQKVIQERHGVHIEIFDGEAIADLLTDRTLYAIAQEYLHLPLASYSSEGIGQLAEPEVARARYLELLIEYCSDLPSWFPDELDFVQIQQEVSVAPPSLDAEDDGQDEAQATQTFTGTDANRRITAPRHLPWTTALRQFRRVLLIGDPGSGKSWALRGRALRLAQDALNVKTDAVLDSVEQATIPVLVLAPKVEELLAVSSRGNTVNIAKTIASALPDAISYDSSAVDFVARSLEDGTTVELLIDGYDEIHCERPLVATHLPRMIDLIGSGGQLVLTTRPSTVPHQNLARFVTTCVLEPFGEREQSAFVDAWFSTDSAQARRVRRWVSGRRLDLLRTPLLLALYCAVMRSDTDSPPATETELWHRALDRLASEEERHRAVSITSELVRLRLATLEEVAYLFASESGLRDSIAVASAEDELQDRLVWKQLDALTEHHSVIEDLLSTGIIRKSVRRHSHDIEFLHSALRDFMLAQRVSRSLDWPKYLRRIWAQPEWEPVIGYLGAFLEDPNELLLALETNFDDDPLNAARLVAGRALIAGGERVVIGRRERIRNELVVMLASHDTFDRSRASALLSTMQDATTVEQVHGLVHPALPTRVVVSALRTIASSTSASSLAVLIDCATSEDFYLDEREAAVQALADTGTSRAGESLREIAGSPNMEPFVRAVAAFSALRLFDDDRPAIDLLVGDDPSTAPARHAVVERLAAQSDAVSNLLSKVAAGDFTIADPYCRAILASLPNGQSEASRQELADALPMNPALEKLVDSVERCRVWVTIDPLFVTLGRYILSERHSAEWRWLIMERISNGDWFSAGGAWTSIASGLPTAASLGIAEFLVGQITALTEPLATDLRSQIRGGNFGPVVAFAYERSEEESNDSPDEPALDTESSREEDEVENPPLDLGTVLRSNVGPLLKYVVLRELRRTIPDDGEVRRSAASLTNFVAAENATEWIDAAPSVASLIESRLLAAPYHSDARAQLARLRARWPGRGSEVAHSAMAFDARVLDARAEAALIDGDLDDAATMALASVGARQIERRPPTALAATILFAAGSTTGRGHNTYAQVQRYAQALPDTTVDFVLLTSWLRIAAGHLDDVRKLLDDLPNHIRLTNPEVAGLAMACGAAGPAAFDRVVSWAGCKRVTALLEGVKTFTDSPTLTARFDTAKIAATQRAEVLGRIWAHQGPASPGAQGTPKWSELLVRIARRLLERAEYSAAAAVYEAAVEEAPDNATLVNNLGFCQMPSDVGAALQTLERAGGLFNRPFGVNIANRMNAFIRLHRLDEALALGEAFYERGPANEPDAWLWDPNDPHALRGDVNVLEYIIRLGLQAAMELGREDLVDQWEVRLTSRVSGHLEVDNV